MGQNRSEKKVQGVIQGVKVEKSLGSSFRHTTGEKKEYEGGRI